MTRYNFTLTDLLEILKDPELKDDMRVEIGPGVTGISAATVGELRKVTSLPPGDLILVVPMKPYNPESVVKIELAT